MFTRTGVDKLATDPVGTGPYKLRHVEPRRLDHARPATTATGARSRYFRPSTLKYFKDPTALNNALLTGTINVIGTVQAPESLAQFSSNSKYQVIEGTTNGEVVLSFNNAKAPLNDVRVRQAVPLRRSTTRR